MRGILADESDGGWNLLKREFRHEPLYGGGRGTPYRASFSPDGKRIALSYRGLPLNVWAVESGHHIGRCERVSERGKNRNDLWCYAQQLEWNPITEHLVGIYNDGCVFKWFPPKNQSEEMTMPSESTEEVKPIMAIEIACSPDGKFVVTANGNGCLWIWSFDNFTLLYHIAGESTMTNITIDFDCRRIYDLRESFCNIWEPNVLISLADDDGQNFSGSPSLHTGRETISQVSDTPVAIMVPITVLSASKTTTTYCSGNFNGMITCVGTAGARGIDEGFSPITHMVMHDNEGLIAIAESYSRVSLSTASENASRLELETGTRVRQLLFTEKGDSLLVHSRQSATIWSLSSRSMTASVALNGEPLHWIVDPRTHCDFIAFGLITVSRYSSDNLHLKASRSYRDHESMDRDQLMMSTLGREYFEDVIDGFIVSNIYSIPYHSRVVVELSKVTDTTLRTAQLLVLDTADIPEDDMDKNETSNLGAAQALPLAIQSRIEIALGLIVDLVAMGRSRTDSDLRHPTQRISLAFIDHDFWVCSWPMENLNSNIIKRHFFLPRDWINMECLPLALVTPDGRFLCPRNGEVACIRNAFREEWLD